MYMGRVPRIDIANLTYHVINRSNGRATIFETEQDFEAFEQLLEEAKAKHNINLYSYQIMPNHWHFCLSPQEDGEMTRFVQWLTMTHTKRWHAFRGSTGSGHVYQGRYKSFLVQDGEGFLQLCRYTERNALRAGLVRRAEDWQWSSLWRKMFGDMEKKSILSPWPIDEPQDYAEWVNAEQPADTIEKIRTSVIRCSPYGKAEWVGWMADQFNLGSTLRTQGRPKKDCI